MQKIPELDKMKVMIWSFELPPQDELWSCTNYASLIGNQQMYHGIHSQRKKITLPTCDCT